MSDLVKRLRSDAPPHQNIENDAADEIERLTRERDEATRQRDDMFAYQESVSENLRKITKLYDEACDSAAIPRADKGILTPWYRVKLMAAALAASRSQVVALREPTARLLDMIYPADVFTGESGDPGALAVVEVRKALADTAAVAAATERRLRVEGAEAMRSKMTREYSDALTDGCDPNGAHDCATELTPAAVVDAATAAGRWGKP